MQKHKRSGGRRWLHYWVLSGLKEAEGEGSKGSITQWVLKRIEGELVASDYEGVKTGETNIENAIAFAQADLVEDRRMESGTLKDVWRISEQGRRWLEQHPTPWKRGNLRGLDEEW